MSEGLPVWEKRARVRKVKIGLGLGDKAMEFL
jgi:hypothetical protein